MRNAKRMGALILGGIMAVSLVGCGGSGQTAATTAATTLEIEITTAATETAQEETTEAGTAVENADTSKTLVVYYSATGVTEKVGNMIAETMGADVFELTPVEPYTSDDLNWRDDNSRVSVEHENPDNRHVELTATEAPDFASYDTVFIGYPIWWQSAAWVVDDFVKGNDFTGKTVVPFCTSSSSPLGQSGTELAAMAGTGDWMEGERFTSGTDQEDVDAWLNSVGLRN